MNYTTNYHLPQWVETDRIMMEDFNDAMSGIDGGINEAKEAAEAAQDTADAAQTAAATAQTTAAAAQTTANAAYSPSNKPYVTGSYVGTGSSVTITLGFKPSFLIISGMISSTLYADVEDWANFFALCNGTVLSKRVTFTATGFTAKAQGPGADYYPDLTDEGRTYCYIAFR